MTSFFLDPWFEERPEEEASENCQGTLLLPIIFKIIYIKSGKKTINDCTSNSLQKVQEKLEDLDEDDKQALKEKIQY